MDKLVQQISQWMEELGTLIFTIYKITPSLRNQYMQSIQQNQQLLVSLKSNLRQENLSRSLKQFNKTKIRLKDLKTQIISNLALNRTRDSSLRKDQSLQNSRRYNYNETMAVIINKDQALKQIRGQNYILKKDNERIKQNNNSLNKQIQNLTQKINEIQRNYQIIKQKNNEISIQLHVYKKISIENDQIIKHQQKQQNKLIIIIDRANQQILEFSKELQFKNNQLSRSLHIQNISNEENTQLRIKLQTKDRQINHYLNEIQQNTKKMQFFVDENQKLTKQLSQINVILSNLKYQNGNLGNQNKMLQNKINNLIYQLQQQRTKYESQIVQKYNQRQRLQQDINKLSLDFSQNQQLLSLTQNNVKILTKNLNQTSQACQSLDNLLLQKDHQIVSLKKHIEDLQRTLQTQDIVRKSKFQQFQKILLKNQRDLALIEGQLNQSLRQNQQQYKILSQNSVMISNLQMKVKSLTIQKNLIMVSYQQSIKTIEFKDILIQKIDRENNKYQIQIERLKQNELSHMRLIQQLKISFFGIKIKAVHDIRHLLDAHPSNNLYYGQQS